MTTKHFLALKELNTLVMEKTSSGMSVVEEEVFYTLSDMIFFL